MHTLYTAVGRYRMLENEAGQKRPVLLSCNKQFDVAMEEFIIWSILLNRVLTPAELEEAFLEKCVDAKLEPHYPYEAYVDSLVDKRVIARGRDLTDVDALYDLMKDLYIVPAIASLPRRVWAFLKFTFIKRMPLEVTKRLFTKEEYTPDEQQVLGLARQTVLSTAELIKCCEVGATNLSSNEKAMRVLYGDGDATCYNIGYYVRDYPAAEPILMAVVNLYLRGQVLLERNRKR